MTYRIKKKEICLTCGKIVLRDYYDEHILLNYDDSFCECKDVE